MSEAIGDLDTIHAPRGDQQVGVMDCRLAGQYQMAAALTDDFVDGRHTDPHVAEAAGCDEVAVVYEARHRLGHGHPLVNQLPRLVFPHPLPVLVRVVPADQLAVAFLKDLH